MTIQTNSLRESLEKKLLFENNIFIIAFQVYLVSEHIWCDDFLVRSFYLKNLKTTETRTVTQFHFLTWPEGGIPSAPKPLLEFRRYLIFVIGKTALLQSILGFKV